jgi:hypothetical protein
LQLFIQGSQNLLGKLSVSSFTLLVIVVSEEAGCQCAYRLSICEDMGTVDTSPKIFDRLRMTDTVTSQSIDLSSCQVYVFKDIYCHTRFRNYAEDVVGVYPTWMIDSV